MNAFPASTDTGLEVIDLQHDEAFAARPPHGRDIAVQIDAMERIARAFVESPETILQELVNSAVLLCGADSAGISVQEVDDSDKPFYHWVATAGAYSDFLGAILPLHPSACTICLARDGPQHFRVGQAFFDLLGIDAPLVTDGILLPWHVDETRGTIFVMAHGRTEAFNQDDCRLMQVFAGFAAMGIRQQRQHRLLLERATAAAAVAMANDLAHKINNPLQGLTNLLYLAAEGHHGEGARVLGREAEGDLKKLSSLVGTLLQLPYRERP